MIEGVFPLRNRGAQEGSPERATIEAGSKTIETTYGHVATKLFEILSPFFDDQGRVLEIVRETCPAGMHKETVEYGAGHTIVTRVSRYLNACIRESVTRQINEMLEKFREDVRPLGEEAKRNGGSIPLGRLIYWLKSADLSGAEKPDADRLEKIIQCFGYYVGSGDLGSLLEEKGLSEESRAELISADDIIFELPHAIVDTVSVCRQEAFLLMREAHERVERLFVVTPCLRYEIEGKYPIKDGN